MIDYQVIGVKPSIRATQFASAMRRNSAPLNTTEIYRVYDFAKWLDIDPAFIIALWAHEGGRTFGSSDFQRRTRNALAVKGADGKFLTFESFQLGLFYGILHLKQRYGSNGLLTVGQIIPVYAPTSDGNNPATYIKSVIEDIEYMRAHE
jgi:hypothetical protein